MKCKKCGKKNSEESKFCAYCGTSLKNTPDFQHQDLVEKITDHLEFIGYESGTPETSDDNSYVRIFYTHASRSNITITFTSTGLMTFVSHYTLNKDKVTKKWLEALSVANKMNFAGIVCAYCLAEDGGSFICSSWHPGEYSKKLFSDFIERYENDIKSRINSSGIIDFS